MNIRNTVIRIHLVLGLVALLHGCILPYPMPTEPTRIYISKQDMSFLEAGQTTKADVREALGSPLVVN